MSIDGFLAQLLSLRTTESATPEWLGGEAWVTLPSACSDAPAPLHARLSRDPSADWIPL